MINQPLSITGVFDSLIKFKGEELAEEIPEDKPRTTLATVSYALGFQAALELALLSPEMGRRLITMLHEQQEHDSPGSSEEFNQTALQFIGICSSHNVTD